MLRENAIQRRVDASPFGEQLRQHLRASLRQPVEAFIALRVLPPLADQEPLGFEPAQQRVQRAFVHCQPVLGEQLAEGVAVPLLPQRRQHGHREAAAPELEAEVLKRGWIVIATVRHILSST